MSLQKRKQIERKQKKKRLKAKSDLTLNSMKYLEQQKKKINKLPLSEEEKVLQISLIERSIKLENEDITNLRERIGEITVNEDSW